MKGVVGAVCDRCNQPFLARVLKRDMVCPDCVRGGIPADEARASLAASRRNQQVGALR